MADNTYSSNNERTLVAVSNSDGLTPVNVWADPSTHRLLTDVSISSLTVTDIQDGAGDSIMDASNDAMRVNVVAGSSSGTQYTEGDTDTTITGTAIMWEDTSDTLRAVSAANPLPVDATVNATISFGDTSALGTNSSNEASNSSYSNWSTNTWTGDGEQNDYAHVAVDLFTDDAGGTLYFDFSNDGTNWSTFPTAGFAITSSTQRFESAIKSSRYFRPRFVGSGSRTVFRLYTHYGQTLFPTNSPLNQPMASDSSAQVVKSAHQVQYQTTPSTVADGKFDVPSITRHKQIRTRDQVSLDLQDCNDATDFTEINDDTDNLADSTNHQFGTGAITFDKVDGAGNTIYAGVSFALSSVDIQELFEDGGFVGLGCYLPSINNVVRVILRLGTDSSNYNEWRWEVEDLVASRWNRLREATGNPATYAGNGWNTADLDYGAVLVEFNSQSNTLTGIVIDNIHLVSGRVTEQEQLVSITSNVTGSKVDLTKISGNTVAVNTGNADTGTQRVVLASNQPVIPISDNSGSITVDNAGTFATQAAQSGTWNITNVSGTVSLPTGASTAANQSTIIGHVDGIETLLGTIDADTSTLAGAVSGTEMQVDIVSSAAIPITDNSGSITVDNGGTFVTQIDGDALTALQLIDDVVYADDADWTDGTSKHALVGGLYQSTPQTVTDGDVAPFNITANGALHTAVQNTVTVDATSSGDVPITLDGETVTVDLGANNDVTLATLPDTASGDLAAINSALSGTLTVDLGANNDVTVTNATAANLKVDGSDVTQPVSGTVTANLSTTDNAVLDNIEAGIDELKQAGTSTVTSLASETTSAQALASNTDRVGAYFYNSDANICYLKLGTTATTSIGGYTIPIASGGFYELPTPCYTGRIDAIWDGDGSGGLSITEID